MNFSRCVTRIAALAIPTASLGANCSSGANTADQRSSTGLEPGVESFSAALGAGWYADSSGPSGGLEDYVEGSDVVVEARLVGVSEGPVIRVDEQPDSPTVSFVYVRFQPVNTLIGELRDDAAGEIRIEYPRPPGATAAALEELIPGQPNAILFVEDPRDKLNGFSVPHVYLGTVEAGIVLESDTQNSPQNSPLVVLVNDEAEGAGTAFGYETLAELRGAIAVTSEDASTLTPANPIVSGPGPADTSNGASHVFE